MALSSRRTESGRKKKDMTDERKQMSEQHHPHVTESTVGLCPTVRQRTSDSCNVNLPIK